MLREDCSKFPPLSLPAEKRFSLTYRRSFEKATTPDLPGCVQTEMGSCEKGVGFVDSGVLPLVLLPDEAAIYVHLTNAALVLNYGFGSVRCSMIVHSPTLIKWVFIPPSSMCLGVHILLTRCC
jgi:hypothetical protein